VVRPIQYQEIVLHQVMSLSPLMPHYWSQLFVVATQLLSAEELHEMEKMIGQVEMIVNGKERYVELADDGTPTIKERSKGVLTLYDIEMAFESNPDYYAYFERDDGIRVTKFDIERELDKIRKWLFLKVKDRAYNMRFTRM
jgi:hypothetical protein